jgi:hypothetical protein
MRAALSLAMLLLTVSACAETRVRWHNERAEYVSREVAEEACEVEWIMAPQNRIERQHFRGIMIECMASYGWHQEVWEVK